MTLREVRAHRGLSLTDVERTTGVHRGTLSKIERGLEAPTAEQLAAIAGALGVPAGMWAPRLMLVCPDTAVTR